MNVSGNTYHCRYATSSVEWDDRRHCLCAGLRCLNWVRWDRRAGCRTRSLRRRNLETASPARLDLAQASRRRERSSDGRPLSKVSTSRCRRATRDRAAYVRLYRLSAEVLGTIDAVVSRRASARSVKTATCGVGAVRMVGLAWAKASVSRHGPERSSCAGCSASSIRGLTDSSRARYPRRAFSDSSEPKGKENHPGWVC
jgi:hypothetical protein